MTSGREPGRNAPRDPRGPRSRRELPPVPVTLHLRAAPGVPPRRIGPSASFPSRVIIAEVANGADGRGIAGAYLGDGPGLTDVGGRFIGPAAPEHLEPPGRGSVRTLDGFLDRVIWRPVYGSRFGFVAWDPAAFFSSLAHSFRKSGTWAVVFTDPDPAGGRRIDYYRSPIVLEPRANGRIQVRFGPRKHPDPRDYVDGRQYAGRFASLQDAASALSGERVEDLATACRLFDVKAPPPGEASIQTLPRRIAALRELYRATREEAERWP